MDRAIQKFCARRIDLVVSYGDAWVTSNASALSVQRAQFIFSTHGIVTHSQARGGEAGAQPTFFHEQRASKAARDAEPLACRLCATQGSAYVYKDALKEYKPQQVKVVK